MSPLYSLLFSLLLLAAATLSPAVGQSTNPSFVPSISWTSASPNILPRRTYPACAYNIHVATTSLPAMFVLGGELNYSSQLTLPTPSLPPQSSPPVLSHSHPFPTLRSRPRCLIPPTSLSVL